MGRINRRIYATRRKKSSALKSLLNVSPGVAQGIQAQNAGPRREYSAEEIHQMKKRGAGPKVSTLPQGTQEDIYNKASNLPKVSTLPQYAQQPKVSTLPQYAQQQAAQGGLFGRDRAQETVRTAKVIANPPYLSGKRNGDTGIGGGKTYNITEA